MKNQLEILVDISRFYGNNPEYIIAGGGNTSFKTDDKIWVKASGSSMADIDEHGFVCLDRKKLQGLTEKEYSIVPDRREEEVKTDLKNAILYPLDKRPSVETSLHEVISFPFVVHTHPAMINGLLCSRDSRKIVPGLFEDTALYIEYTDPGYILFKKVYNELVKFRKEKRKEPNIIFLENHGVFVGADSIGEIKEIYNEIDEKLKLLVKEMPDSVDKENSELLSAEINQIESHFEDDFYVLPDACPLVQYFVKNSNLFDLVSKPFTPDHIVYCKSKYLFVRKSDNLMSAVEVFKKSNGFLPKIIGIENKGLLAFEQDKKSSSIAMDVFKDMMKIAWYSNFFGGPRHMNQQQIDFIDNWEVENYRRQMSKQK